MSKNDELLLVEFWQDSDRIIQYCQSILSYAAPDRMIRVGVSFKGERAYVDHSPGYTQAEITIPIIDPLDDLQKQIMLRAYFLRVS